MFKRTSKLAIAGALALALVGAGASAASAAVPVGSANPIYFYSPSTGLRFDAATSLAYTSTVIASPSDTDVAGVIQGPADAEGVIYFVSKRGEENDITKYMGYLPAGFGDPTAKTVNTATFKLSQMTTGVNGGAAAVRSAGGNYSIGVAFTKNTNTQLASGQSSFAYINVTAGTGAWTFETPTTTPTGVAPAFTTQPGNATVTAGATASFTVAASGTPAPTFKWQSSTDGTTWADIAGATAATYTTPATAVADSGKKFRAIASNGTAPDATSNVATLTVNAVKTEPTQPTGTDAGKVTITDPAVDATTITVPLGSGQASKTLTAWAWSTPTNLGSVSTDASGTTAPINISSLPAGQHTIAFTLPGDSTFTVLGWGTFTIPPRTVNPGDPISKNVNLTAAVTAADLWSLNAEKSAVDFGSVARGAQVTKPLGKVTVVDDRNQLKGWDLKATWTDFTGAKNIGKDVLTLTPKFAAGYTPTDAGITLSTVTGTSGAKAFGSSIAGVTTTAAGAVFDADLTFKAPANADAGAYASTLTLTLTTK